MEELDQQIDQLTNPKQADEQQKAQAAATQKELAAQATPRDSNNWEVADDIDRAIDPDWQHKQLAAARQKFEGEETPLIARVGERMIPFASALSGVVRDKLHKTAQEDFDNGTASRGTINLLAELDHYQKNDAERGTGGKLANALLNIPAIVGEAALTGPAKGATWAGRAGMAALKTPLMPSLYAEQASQRALQQGGEVYSPQNLLPALGFGAVQNMVMGSAPLLASGIVNPIKRFAAKTALGVGELQGAQAAAGLLDEFLPDAYKTKTKYGALGQMWRGEFGELAQSAVIDTVTMAAFTALHGNPAHGKEIIDGLKESLDDLHAQGKTPEEAAAIIQARANEAKKIITDGEAGKQSPDGTDDALEKITGQKQKPLPAPPLEPEDLTSLNRDKEHLNRQLDASNKALEAEKKRTAKVSSSDADIETQATPEDLAMLSKADPKLAALRSMLDEPRQAEPGQKEPLLLTDQRGKQFSERELANLDPEAANLRRLSEMGREPPKTAPPGSSDEKIVDPVVGNIGEPTRQPGPVEKAFSETFPGAEKHPERMEWKAKFGNRDIYALHDPEKNSVHIDFGWQSDKAPDGTPLAGPRASIPKTLQVESLPMVRKIRSFVGKLKDAGVGVDYLSQDGRSDVYRRVMEKAGFKQTEGPTEHTEGTAEYAWKPKGMADRILDRKRASQTGENAAPKPSGDNAQKPLGTSREFAKPKAHEKYKPDLSTWEMENLIRQKAGLGPKENIPGRGGEAYTRRAATVQDVLDSLDEKPPGAEAPSRSSTEPKTRAQKDAEYQAYKLENLATMTNRHYGIMQDNTTPGNTMLFSDAVGKLAERAEKFGMNPVAYLSKRLPAVMDHVGPEKLKELIAAAKELKNAVESDSKRSGIEPQAVRRAVVGELQGSAEVPQASASPEGAVVGDQGSSPSSESSPAVRSAQPGDVVDSSRQELVKYGFSESDVKDFEKRAINGGNIDRMTESLETGSDSQFGNEQKMMREHLQKAVAEHIGTEAKGLSDEAAALAKESGKGAKVSETIRQGIQAGYESEGTGDTSEGPQPPSAKESADPNAGGPSNFATRPGESDGLDPRTGRAVDGGPDGLNPVDQQKVKEASAKIIGDAVQEFIKGDSGAVDIDKLRDQFFEGMNNTWDATKRIFGRSFPAMRRISRLVNEAAGMLANAQDFSRRAGSYYGDIVFGRDATQEQVTRTWSAMMELRFRHTINQHIRRSREASIDASRARANGDMGAAGDYARESSWHMNARAAVETLIGKPNSPFQHEYEYQAALKDPYVQQVMDNYIKKYVPFKNKTFIDSQGLDENDPLNSFTQIPNMPMRFVSVGEGEEASTALYANQGKLTNPKLRKDPASYAATLASQNYELNGKKVIAKDIIDSYPKAAQAVLYRTMEAEGVAVWRSKGDHEPLAGIKMEHFPDVNPPKATQAAARGETEFHVAEAIAPEFRKLISVDKNPGFVKYLAMLNHIPGMAALASSVEAVSHGTNLAGAMFHPVADVADALRSPMDFYKNLEGKLRGSDEFNSKILELAKIQATKPSGSEAGIFTPNWLKELLPGAEKYDPTYHLSKWLHGYDEIVRATLSDAYDHLAAKNKAPNTDAGKRDFINQWTGNYNRKAQSSLVSFLRETELQPFAVAATTMTARGIRNLVGSPGISDVGIKTNLQLRASVLAKLVLLPVAGMMANYVRFGRIDGDDNTPYGAMKITQDATGKTSYMDLLGIVGIRRGLNALGIMPYMEARRHGESTGKAMNEGAMGTAHALLHTVFGPGPQFLWTAATGKDALGRQIAEDPAYGEMELKKNAQAALAHANPAYAALTASDVEPGKDVPYGERVAKLFGNLGPKFATERQPPDVREFRERYEALKKEELKLTQAAHSVGKERSQSPVLTMFHQAAIELGKVNTVMRSPLTSPDKRKILQERSATLARKVIDAKLKYDDKKRQQSEED